MIENRLRLKLNEVKSLSEGLSEVVESRLLKLANEVSNTLMAGGKIAFMGNGGSAAEAIHLAAEFVGKCVLDHKPWSAICLNESQSVLTAIANDFGYDQVFARQVEAHLRTNDLLIALSTSGKSPNILNAIDYAKKNGIKTILWTGNWELSIQDVDIWKVASQTTPRIQEIHLIWGHLLAELVELMMTAEES